MSLKTGPSSFQSSKQKGRVGERGSLQRPGLPSGAKVDVPSASSLVFPGRLPTLAMPSLPPSTSQKTSFLVTWAPHHVELAESHLLHPQHTRGTSGALLWHWMGSAQRPGQAFVPLK